METLYNEIIFFFGIIGFGFLTIILIVFVPILKDCLYKQHKNHILEKVQPTYENNEEYDYGHNVKRYHVDGEGEYSF